MGGFVTCANRCLKSVSYTHLDVYKRQALLYERFKAGKLPLTVQSMDNCSHNGDKVKTAVHTYAAKWVKQGLVPVEFLAYVQDETKITFPWSMIDKITPRPDARCV